MKISKLSALLVAAAFGLLSGIAGAKLPPPTPEAQAKADEAKAKAAAAAEVEKANLAKAQDRVAARYIEQQKEKGITVTPTPVVAPPAAAGAPSTTPAAASPTRPLEKAEAHSAPVDPKGDAKMDGKVTEKNEANRPK
ncbi:MAG: hypothetical protein ACR2FI_13495 [Burkholderiales bacterium]|nr:formate dehydrogenase [Burkholderiales bacterium]MDQ3196452.1 formate dehydrogenase [Pseudomonadota bacterium]